MTLDELDRIIDQRIALVSPAPVVSMGQLPGILAIPAGSWWAFCRAIDPKDMPATFRVGGSDCMTKDTAADWCKRVVRQHPQRFGVEGKK